MKEKTELMTFCSQHNLSIHWKNKSTLASNVEIEPEDWIELENNTSLGKNELQLTLEMSTSINQLIQAEEDRTRYLILMEKENSKKIKQ